METSYRVFSEETRRDRKALLIASSVGIAIGASGIIPTRISALGIEFSTQDRVALLWVLSGVVVYFAVSFGLHAASDYFVSRRERTQRIHELEESLRSGSGSYSTSRWQLTDRKREGKWSFWSFLHATFEFVLPMGLAVLALVMLLSADVRSEIDATVSTQSSRPQSPPDR